MEELGIGSLEWPPQSADGGPIENAWWYMKTYLHNQPRHPAKIDECWEHIKNLREELPLEYFQKLIGSMASKIEAVLDNNWDATSIRVNLGYTPYYLPG